MATNYQRGVSLLLLALRLPALAGSPDGPRLDADGRHYLRGAHSATVQAHAEVLGDAAALQRSRKVLRLRARKVRDDPELEPHPLGSGSAGSTLALRDPEPRFDADLAGGFLRRGPARSAPRPLAVQSRARTGLQGSTHWAAHLERSDKVADALRRRHYVAGAKRAHRLQQHLEAGRERVNRTAANPVTIGGEIGFWPHFYEKDRLLGPGECSVPCRWTMQEGEREAAQVSIHHFFDDTPGVRDHRRRPGQLVATMTLEAEMNRWVEDVPKFATAYPDLLVSYSPWADVRVSYTDQLADLLEGQAEFEAAHPLPPEWLAGPRAMMATFVSNCPDPGANPTGKYTGRNALVSGLAAEGITFDHFGGCKFGAAPNPALPSPVLDGSHYKQLSQRRKVQLLKHYPFALALENTVDEGYVTEKFYQAFLSGRLPVYLGAPDAALQAPPHSFINGLEYSPKGLAALLKELAASPALYEEYFEWRLHEGENLTTSFGPWIGRDDLFGRRKDGFDWVCKVCKLYHKYYDFPEDPSNGPQAAAPQAGGALGEARGVGVLEGPPSEADAAKGRRGEGPLGPHPRPMLD